MTLSKCYNHILIVIYISEAGTDAAQGKHQMTKREMEEFAMSWFRHRKDKPVVKKTKRVSHAHHNDTESELASN